MICILNSSHYLVAQSKAFFFVFASKIWLRHQSVTPFLSCAPSSTKNPGSAPELTTFKRRPCANLFRLIIYLHVNKKKSLSISMSSYIRTALTQRPEASRKMAYNILETLQTTPCSSQQCNRACPRQGRYGVFKWKAKFIFLFSFLFIFFTNNSEQSHHNRRVRLWGKQN